MNLHESYKHVLLYMLSSESKDLYESMQENEWNYEQAMDNHVLGHTLCVAYQLGMLEGGVDEEIQEILSQHGDYEPVPEDNDEFIDAVDQLVKTYGSWGEHSRFVRADWRSEVANGETNLGYWDWILQQEEIFGDDEPSTPAETSEQCSFSKAWLSAKDAAKELGISRTTLFRLRLKGFLTPRVHYIKITPGKTGKTLWCVNAIQTAMNHWTPPNYNA